MNTDDVQIWQEGPVGRLHLNRPKALNALSSDMSRAMKTALDGWREDASIKIVLIDAEGDRAFCAGGDIRELYDTGKDNPEAGRKFWREEYQLNALIDNYPKPYIAIMDGITMGGGVGISAHGSHRIVSERTMLAMPETAIGFLPDAGASYLLSRSPGKTGLYLGMTGARLDAADAIYAGFADYYIESKYLNEFISLLCSGTPIDAAIKKFMSSPTGGTLKNLQEKIDKAFDHKTVLECANYLNKMAKEGDEWAKNTYKQLTSHSPLSIAATFETIKTATNLPLLVQCLALEYRFAHRVLEHDDFYEGVRTAVIDKKDKPKWSPNKLEDVTSKMVSCRLAPLGENEWRPS